VGVVDVPAAGPFAGLFEERLEVWRRAFHARAGRGQAGAEIAQDTVCGRPLCTIIRPAGNDADALIMDDQETPNCTAIKAPEEMPDIELSLISAL
jgi:hypothetical protein